MFLMVGQFVICAPNIAPNILRVVSNLSAPFHTASGWDYLDLKGFVFVYHMLRRRDRRLRGAPHGRDREQERCQRRRMMNPELKVFGDEGNHRRSRWRCKRRSSSWTR